FGVPRRVAEVGLDAPDVFPPDAPFAAVAWVVDLVVVVVVEGNRAGRDVGVLHARFGGGEERVQRAAVVSVATELARLDVVAFAREAEPQLVGDEVAGFPTGDVHDFGVRVDHPAVAIFARIPRHFELFDRVAVVRFGLVEIAVAIRPPRRAGALRDRQRRRDRHAGDR